MNRFILLFLIFSMACTKEKNHDKKTADAEGYMIKPQFAEIITQQTSDGTSYFCNAVRLKGDRIITANECLKKESSISETRTSKSILNRTFELLPQTDLAIAFDGESAPSSGIEISPVMPNGRFEVQAIWFDLRSQTWRWKKGYASFSDGYLNHDIDLSESSLGAGIYTNGADGSLELVAINLGKSKGNEENLAVPLSQIDRKISFNSSRPSYFNVEVIRCSYDTGPSGEILNVRCESGSDALDDGSSGGGFGGSASGGGESPTGSAEGLGDNGDGTVNNGSGSDLGSNDGSGSTGSGSTGSGIIGRGEDSSGGGWPNETDEPSDGGDEGLSGDGGSTPYFETCFDCDKVTFEIEKKNLFKPTCDIPILGSLINSDAFNSTKTAFDIDPRSDVALKNSLKKSASNAIANSKWDTDAQYIPSISQLSTTSSSTLNTFASDIDAVYGKYVKNEDGSASVLANESNGTFNAISEEKIEEERGNIQAANLQLDLRPAANSSARRLALNAADQALDLSSQALKNNETDKAQFAFEVGRTLADFGLGFFPPTSVGKAIVEIATGFNHVTNQKLETLDYIAAWADVLTAGVGGGTAVGVVATAMKLEVVQVAVKGLAHASIVAATGKQAEKILSGVVGSFKLTGDKITSIKNAIKFKKPSVSALDLEKETLSAIENLKNVPPLNGRPPINGYYANQTYFDKLSPELKAKYPKGVEFTKDGMPDFSPYTTPLPNGGRSVQITPKFDNSADFRAADKAAGIKAMYRKNNQLTWHHHQDFGKMELIPTDIHNAVKHNGGVSIWGTLFE